MLSKNRGFGSQRSSVPIVMIFAQQHGNEASGKEAALILTRKLALGSLQELLEHIDIIIVPIVNPDGAEEGKRKNTNDMDLNRNHAILSEPEVYTLHKLFHKWMPEVTLDVHEFNAISKHWTEHGFVKDADVMLDRVTNLNVAEQIISYSDDIILKEIENLIAATVPKRCYIQMDYFLDLKREVLNLPVFDFNLWKHILKEANNYEPLVRIKKSVRKPVAYIFSQKEKQLIDI